MGRELDDRHTRDTPMPRFFFDFDGHVDHEGLDYPSEVAARREIMHALPAIVVADDISDADYQCWTCVIRGGDGRPAYRVRLALLVDDLNDATRAMFDLDR